MPELDGFAVLKRIKAVQMPVVVFTTAYDQYAVRAFAVHALDYLLKPFDEERFTDMIRRVEDRLSAGEERLSSRQLSAILKTLAVTKVYPERVTVRGHGKIVPIPGPATSVWLCRLLGTLDAMFRTWRATLPFIDPIKSALS